MMLDRFTGKAETSPGMTFYVLPTTDYSSYDADAFVRNVHEFVYDTMDLALAQCVAGRGDNIVLLPGAHVPTASLVMSKAGVSVWGPEAWMGKKVRKPSAVVTAPAGDECMNITAADISITGLTVVPVTSESWADMDGGADGLTIRDCYIDLTTPVVEATTEGFTASAAIEDFLFTGNTVWSDGAQGPALELTGANLNSVIEHCHFHCSLGTWVSAINAIAIDGLVLRHSIFTCGGTAMTAGITASSTTVIAGLFVHDCRNDVLVTKMIDGFATTTHCALSQNYIGSVGVGDGGVTAVVLAT